MKFMQFWKMQCRPWYKEQSTTDVVVDYLRSDLDLILFTFKLYVGEAEF